MAEQLNTETQVPAGAQEKSFPPFDPTTYSSQLFWLVITFTFLYLVLSKLAVPRIGEVLEERRDRIQRDLDKAAELREDTEKAIASYEEALASARAKANGIADETRAKLNAEINAERADIEETINKKSVEAENSIREAKSAALGEVNKIAAETTETIVEKLLGARPDAGDVQNALQS